jgi:ribosomal-protein-serine acetyltransferase
MLTRPLQDDVYLRLPEERHAEAIYAVVEANRDYLARWLPWAPGQTRDLTLEFIRRVRREYAENRGYTLTIVRGDEPIGTVGFNAIDWTNRQALIGYWLAESAQGQGIMTAAVNALTAHGFDDMGLHRLEIRAGVENKPSRAVAERCGYQFEGVRREAELVGGRWVSHAAYARLAVDGD